MDWFTSDLHMNHTGILKHRPEFSSVDEMNETLFKMFDPVRKGDRVFLLGDICWRYDDLIKLFDILLIKKKAIVYWIEGNHDKELFKKDYNYKNLHKCQSIYIKGYKDYQPIFMSHYPQILWDHSYYNSYMLHGHGHESTADRPMLDNMVFGKRLNVNVELHDYKLWNRDEVENYMKDRPNNMETYLMKEGSKEEKIVKDYLKAIKFITDDMYEKLAKC